MSIQPTEDRIKKIEEKQEDFDKRLREVEGHQTEPIVVPRIELDPGGIQNRLDNHAEMLKEISTKQDEQEQQLTLIYTDVGHMKADIGVLKGDVSVLKQTAATQSQLDELRQAMEKRFDAIAEVQKLILARLPEKGE